MSPISTLSILVPFTVTRFPKLTVNDVMPPPIRSVMVIVSEPKPRLRLASSTP